MASVIQKKVGPVGSTGMITVWGVDGTVKLEYTDGISGEEVKFTPTKIAKVINMSGANATVDGVSYGPGSWDLFASPVPCNGGWDCEVAGNCHCSNHGRVGEEDMKLIREDVDFNEVEVLTEASGGRKIFTHLWSFFTS